MHANQHTSRGAKVNLNTRITPEMRDGLDVEATRRQIDRSDLIREAIEHYLPISRLLPAGKPPEETP
jgi:hypothetical protein